MKTDDQRGPIGAWARRARLDAGYSSADKAVEAMRGRGIELELTYLRGIESGNHRPSRELVSAIGEFYGSTPPAEAKNDAVLSNGVVVEIKRTVESAVALAVAEALRTELEPRLARLEQLLARLAEDPERPRRPH